MGKYPFIDDIDHRTRSQWTALMKAREAGGPAPVVANYAIQRATVQRAMDADWNGWTKFSDDFDFGGPTSMMTWHGVTEGKKRDGSNVRVDGIRSDGLAGNPVFAKFHQYSEHPIGTIIAVRHGMTRGGQKSYMIRVARLGIPEVRENGAVNQRVRDANELMDFAEYGKMRAVSFGWNPEEFEPIVNGAGKITGFDFIRSDALEFSLVTVPADADALQADASELQSMVRSGKVSAEAVTMGRSHAVYIMREVIDAPTDAPTDAEVAAVAASRTDGATHAYGLSAAVQEQLKGELDALERDRRRAREAEVGDSLDREDVPGTVERRPVAVGSPTRATPSFALEAWHPRLRSFDVSAQEFEPATVEYDLVSRWLECKVRDLHERRELIPSARVGSFLSALDQILKEGQWSVDDLRNLDGQGRESPPQYRVIQLNSKLSMDFLVEGTRFLSRATTDAETGEPTRERFVLGIHPSWCGLSVILYATTKDSHVAAELYGRTCERAVELKYLKGEAFAIAGDFLTRGAEDFGDVFLEERNVTPCERVVDLVARDGGAMKNVGQIYMGPPGTGKTLMGRILMNQADATFIWISARDFYYLGAFGGFMQAFELARENAPCVLFFEDVDNWIGPSHVDLLRTEMDGIGQSRGVVTVLTTNYPEHLPRSLIDRPGRFHDVLKFDLPTAEVRAAMLGTWLPNLTDEQRAAAVAETEGYSGAHMRHLADYASTLQEQDGGELGEALVRALTKIREQRELIDATCTEGRRVSPGLVARSLLTPLTVADVRAAQPAGYEHAVEFGRATGRATGTSMTDDDPPASASPTDKMTEAANDIAEALADLRVAIKAEAAEEKAEGNGRAKKKAKPKAAAPAPAAPDAPGGTYAAAADDDPTTGEPLDAVAEALDDIDEAVGDARAALKEALDEDAAEGRTTGRTIAGALAFMAELSARGATEELEIAGRRRAFLNVHLGEGTQVPDLIRVYRDGMLLATYDVDELVQLRAGKKIAARNMERLKQGHAAQMVAADHVMAVINDQEMQHDAAEGGGTDTAGALAQACGVSEAEARTIETLLCETTALARRAIEGPDGSNGPDGPESGGPNGPGGPGDEEDDDDDEVDASLQALANETAVLATQAEAVADGAERDGRVVGAGRRTDVQNVQKHGTSVLKNFYGSLAERTGATRRTSGSDATEAK